ncbi:MAG: O-antigen ligase family protein [Rhodocyclaceae bacterium]|nr:O-antigen ligase family protein [Rhodocyclaceae bacterium]MCA3025432.1 O-antigen ligase family protein [Rhodocyclaceae bacterium]MCA3031650.1 O-antigen ligase family protein [Rhodocyclaceae bacterium]MCA3038297.1 O-antigen ligase family protein [Rhodocyclaceae bacterium]MCA3040184.1 O-antigen ligase family protein [Rhodocyclaceae bacterium]
MPKSFSAKATSRRRFVTKPFDIERWLYWSWVLLLCWLPIPLGSVEPWAFAVMQVGVYTILGVWCVAYSLGRVSPTQAFIHAKWFVWLLVGWLAYLALYLVPLPVDFIALISPATAAIHRETLAFDGGWRTVALEPHAALVSLLKSLAYVSGFVVTLLLVNSRERARQMLSVLVVFALMMAVYGILMHLNQARITWFGSPMFHGDVAKGTYFNRNHFAGYLEMTLALGIGLLIADLRDRKATTWKQFLRNFLEWIFSPKMRLRLMLCVMVIALVSTRSRMGNTAFFASLMVAGIIGIAFSRYATRGTVVLLVSLIAIDVFIVGSWFGVEQLAQRIENTSIVRQELPAVGAQESVEERLDATASTMAMIKDFPLTGVGPGAWSVVFPKYRTEDVMPGFFEYAHNDYAQMAAEFGAIGFLWLGAIVVISFLVAIMAHAKRRDPLMRGLSFASIMGILSIMIHSSVDFNLQIPANTMYFMVLLALAWIALYLDRRPKTPEQVDPGTSDALIHQHTEVS